MVAFSYRAKIIMESQLAEIRRLLEESSERFDPDDIKDADLTTPPLELLMAVMRCLIAFVTAKCQGRDASHSLEHMCQVTINALQIYIKDKIQLCHHVVLLVVVCMLHDVPDHKYDKDGEMKSEITQFILELHQKFPELTRHLPLQYIWMIIDYSSFSKEKKSGGYAKHVRKLHMPMCFIYILNLLADADRLEAIGKTGAIRCIEYTKAKYPGESLDFWRQKVKQHAEEKLYILPFADYETGDTYFRTNAVKEKALELHIETQAYIKRFLETDWMN